MELEALHNKGIVVQGDRSPGFQSQPRTIIVLGVARGGTSIVSGALYHFGVYMGKTATPPVFEDMAFDRVLASWNTKHLRSILDEYNSQHDIWAIKRPHVTRKYIRKIHYSFRNPLYVAIFRDILAIAKRNEISMRFNPLVGLKTAIDDYKKIIQFLQKENPACLLVSYDKAITNKKFFLQQLAEFCGLQPSAVQLAAASQFIEPNPSLYLHSSRVTRTSGRIEIVTRNRIAGWVRYDYKAKRNLPPKVALYINDKLITKIASKKQPEKMDVELASKEIPTDAFIFEYSDLGCSSVIPRLATVRARVIDDLIDLENSPYEYIDKKKL